jgi:DNA-directed RNA polymerase specialized sigma24 family protein
VQVFFKKVRLLNEEGTMMHQNDDELVTLAINGDIEAFAAIVRKYSNFVYASALHYLKDSFEAQDIAQEVLIKAWHSLWRLKEELN